MMTQLSLENAIYQNLQQGLATFGKVVEDEGVFRYSSGIPLFHFNGTYVPGFQKAPFLESHDRFFARNRLPYCAWLGKKIDNTPLIDQGFLDTGTYTGVACEREALTFSPFAPQGVTVEEVEGKPLEEMAELSARIFGIPDISGWHYILKTSPFINFVAYLNGKVVGTASLLMSGKVAGIYNVAVEPMLQHRGIGSAMVAAILRRGLELDASHAVAILMAEKEALALLGRFGIDPVCEIVPYFKEVELV